MNTCDFSLSSPWLRHVILAWLGLSHLIQPLTAQDCYYPTATSTLDFNTAVNRVLTNSLKLSIASRDICAKRGDVVQASLYPNPEFSYDLTPSDGSGSHRSRNEREEVYSLSQLVELGGKRELRTEVASSLHQAAQANYEIARWQTMNQVSKTFIATAIAQERIQLAIHQQEVADAIWQATYDQVDAGKISPIQLNKAEVSRSLASLVLEQAYANWDTQRHLLASLWSSSCPDFQAISFPLFDITLLPPQQAYWSTLCQHPELVQSLFDYRTAYKTWKLEKAQSIPDVVVRVGYQNDRDAGDRGWVFGVTVPIPIFDANQGNIRRAYCETLKAGDIGQQIWKTLELKLSVVYRSAVQAYHNVIHLRDRVLITAQQSFSRTQEGYKEGKFAYLEVLDAQQTLFDTQERYLQALFDYHRYKADLDYLTTEMDI